MPIFWISSFIVELFTYIFPLSSKYKRYLAVISSVIVIASTVSLLKIFPVYLSILLVIFALYRVLNLARVFKSRMHLSYLQKSVIRTFISLILFHCVLFAFFITFSIFDTKFSGTLQLFSLATALVLLISTVINVSKLKYKPTSIFLADSELPTVTVAVPARNETNDLEDCLHSLLASDYPKLEILVLDDCSQDKTADIIKRFAHDGVRFIQGTQPPDRWLAKNYAYQRLLEESNGELVLFCGVDIRFGSNSIRNMVNLMHSRNKSMLSILPTRSSSEPSSAFIQPMRYWWEIVPPRRLFNRPPVLSSCWIISSKIIKKMGEFKSVSHAVIPEGHFARELIKSDEYSFIRSSHDLSIQTVKDLRNQNETAVRMQYPLIRRRPENALFLTLVNTFLFVWPFLSLLLSLFGRAQFSVINLLNCLALISLHIIVIGITNPANFTTAIFNFPLAVMVETFTGYVSMFKYEFGTVEWKERNICIPVMHTYPRLPMIKNTSNKQVS